jgi:hypothetical protein
VRDGLGPYLSIRFVMAVGGVGAIVATGIGAAVSNLVAGSIVVAAGYNAAFVSLGAIAGAGLALYLFAMPETVDTARLDTGT